jgi:hypothetical protein
MLVSNDAGKVVCSLQKMEDNARPKQKRKTMMIDQRSDAR